MKILSIQNQKMQNSNNRLIAFGGFRSVVAAETFYDGHIMAVACRLTGKDLEDFQGILKAFPNPKQESDVLTITADRWVGDNETGYTYKILINGNENTGSQGLYGLFYPNHVFGQVKNKIIGLLRRISCERPLDIPKQGTEERQKMLQFLSPDKKFKDFEIALNETYTRDTASSIELLMERNNESLPYD